MKRKILIVDDEVYILDLLETFLGDYFPDYDVVTRHQFEDGREFALENCSQLSAVFLDRNIGRKNGSEIARDLKRSEFQGEIYSISGNALEPEEFHLYDNRFQKPFKIEEMLSYLNKRL